ncbi:MAG: hypothetical protein QOJ79_1989 [Actinomycetota bacterium]|jgi:glycosyltransferase involved in cell wall biosynthesis|nr:hypothetical protein [Actinomycetota bacterium]
MTASRPRVLHLSQPTDGGVARVVHQIAADQVARGWEVSVGCPRRSELASGLARDGVQVVGWEAVKVKRSATPARLRALRRLIDGVDPDVVHLHSAAAGLAGRLVLRGRRPTLFSPHGWTWQSADDVFGRVARGWERTAERFTHTIVCVSEAERLAGRAAGLAMSSAVVVTNGVDLAAFPAQTPADRRGARQRLGLGDAPLAVCVGRLDDQKGQATLLEAWALVRGQVPAARLALVGDGPARAALDRTARERGLVDAVVFAGAREDVVDWYAAADVVVFGSLYGEGMPLVPIEAQASARAVVASDLPGVREALAAGAGALFPPGDAGAAAAALVPRLRDPARADEEGARGRVHAEAQLDVRQSLDRLAELTVRAVAR